MQRKGHGFLPDRYHCSLVELAGLKCPSCTKCHATACVFAMLAVLLLAAAPQELLSQVGGSTWLPLLLTPPRSHQPLRAPGGSRLPPTLPRFRKPHCPVHHTTGFCCPSCRHRSCSAPELPTPATQHCTTLQKLLTNLYRFVKRLYITTLTLLNYFSSLQ